MKKFLLFLMLLLPSLAHAQVATVVPVQSLNGSAVPGVTVSLIQSGVTIYSAISDFTGLARFPNIAPGTYTVQITGQGIQPQSYVQTFGVGGGGICGTFASNQILIGTSPTTCTVSPNLTWIVSTNTEGITQGTATWPALLITPNVSASQPIFYAGNPTSQFSTAANTSLFFFNQNGGSTAPFGTPSTGAIGAQFAWSLDHLASGNGGALASVAECTTSCGTNNPTAMYAFANGNSATGGSQPLGMQIQVTTSGAGGGGPVGLNLQVGNTGTGTQGTSYGLLTGFITNSTGSMTDAEQIRIGGTGSLNPGTIGSLYGIRILNQGGVASTLGCAICIDNQGTGANDYVFRSLGGKSLHTGAFTFGSTAQVSAATYNFLGPGSGAFLPTNTPALLNVQVDNTGGLPFVVTRRGVNGSGGNPSAAFINVLSTGHVNFAGGASVGDGNGEFGVLDFGNGAAILEVNGAASQARAAGNTLQLSGIISAQVTLNGQAAAGNFTPFTVIGASSQTVDLFDVKNSAGAALFGVNASGQAVSTVATSTAPFVVASTTPVVNLTTVPATYNHSGTQITAAHIVQDSCTLGTSCAVTLAGSAVFTNSTSYTCTGTDDTGINPVKAVQASGSSVTFTGTGTDVIQYICAGN